MHIIPLRYDTPNARNIVTPIGIIDRQLISVFSTISYSGAGLDKIHEHLRGAHIQPAAFYDPHFIYNASFRTPKQTTMFIDFGARYTTASIWTDRGPVAYTKIEIGGTDITNEIRKNQRVDEPSDIVECYVCKNQKSETFQKHGIHQTGKLRHSGVTDNPQVSLA